MPEEGYRETGIPVREAFQCITPPSIYAALRGEDHHFYPARLTNEGDNLSIETIVLDNALVRFEHYNDALAFCQNTSRLSHRLSYAIPSLHFLTF
ncbi:MAG TPA: hypothetical protein VEL31_26075 [Ktedonobacteraceae bacterium]|nr:hypothetical protein [Ktedonobacteraceae bacterium]